MILMMGFRVGAANSLEKKDLPYIVWSERPIKNNKKYESLIIGDYPNSDKDLNPYRSQLEKITHVIAVSEAAVIPASIIRKYLNIYRNTNTSITRCTDKLKMKEYLAEKDIPMTKFLSSKNQTAESIYNKLGLPVVNKLKLSSGGRGVRFIKNREEIDRHINKESYFEQVITGKEGSIESFIVDGKIIFTNITQYYKNGHCNILPGNFEDEIKRKIEKLNLDVLKALRLKWGMTHLEYYITENEVLFGEVAIRPPGGYIMEALEQSYLQNFWDLFIDVELIKENTEINVLSRYSSSIVIHPGMGEVKEVRGAEIVDGLKSKIKFKLKLKKGDIISDRQGVGQDYGHVILANNDLDSLLQDIETFYSRFKIVMI